MPDTKEQILRRRLRELAPVAVAFSGGVDSTYLLYVAVDELGADRVLALTALSPVYPQHELDSCRRIAADLKVRLLEVEADVLQNVGFVENGRERCYHCKLDLFGEFSRLAAAYGCRALLDGSNLDDQGDYRPGHRALAELEVHSPLLDAQLTKSEIRALSRDAGLPTWNKQPFACLATRFPYGTTITAALLEQVGRCEALLHDLGLANYRVRYHGPVARIEVGPEEMARFLEPSVRQAVLQRFHAAGFEYVALDLDGYRTGSMNGPEM